MRARGLGWLVGVVVALLAPAAHADLTPGGLVAERPLGEGSTAMFLGAGYPTVALGYRQGFPGFEGGATLAFDYSLAQFNLDLPFRFATHNSDRLLWGFGGSVGGYYDLGAHYIEDTNLSSAGLRFSAEANLTFRATSLLDVVALATVPLDLCLTERGNHRFGLLVGGGAELGLGDGYSVGLYGQVGPELIHPRGGQSGFRLGINALAGVGKRFF